MQRLVVFVLALGVAVSAHGAPLLDGLLDPEYGIPKAVQTVQSAFPAAKLDAGYGRIEGGKLYLLLTGNLDTFRSNLEIFIDSKAGGQSQFQSPDAGLTAKMNGLEFDNLFAADYFLSVRRGPVMANGRFDLDFADLGNQTFSSYTDLFGGLDGNANTPTGANSQPIGVAYDDSNIGGVGYNAPNAPVPLDAGANATAGLELVIDLGDLGYAGGVIRVMAGLNGQGHDFWSNQFLGGLPAPQGAVGGDGMGGFTASGAIDMNQFDGNQFFTIAPDSRVVPEPSSMALLLVLLGGLTACRRRRTA